MEITWHAQSCFRLTERNLLTIVTDPYKPQNGMEMPKLKADVVTVSREAETHNNTGSVSGTARGDTRVVNGPGEYEMGGVFITGVTMRPDKKKSADANQATLHPALKSTVYSFNYDGLNVVHLGGLSFVPSQTQIDALETVHVLLLPIGGGEYLNPSQAAEVVSLIEPNIVIPMQYDAGQDVVGKFLKGMGLSEAKAQDSLKVTRGTLPEDTQVVLLEAKK